MIKNYISIIKVFRGKNAKFIELFTEIFTKIGIPTTRMT